MVKFGSEGFGLLTTMMELALLFCLVYPDGDKHKITL
jgi:hypothetical protein